MHIRVSIVHYCSQFGSFWWGNPPYYWEDDIFHMCFFSSWQNQPCIDIYGGLSSGRGTASLPKNRGSPVFVVGQISIADHFVIGLVEFFDLLQEPPNCLHIYI